MPHHHPRLGPSRYSQLCSPCQGEGGKWGTMLFAKPQRTIPARNSHARAILRDHKQHNVERHQGYKSASSGVLEDIPNFVTPLEEVRLSDSSTWSVLHPVQPRLWLSIDSNDRMEPSSLPYACGEPSDKHRLKDPGDACLLRYVPRMLLLFFSTHVPFCAKVPVSVTRQ
ncbi:hypothetical protein BV25DRAFT_1525598 [Artomyces pyxidatus]|uniref:Uncharacterized protein n=1 Tax=Artomyces pyxidatus TaxID=48021 RepID=A0ACB8TD28_9AGAM|nr:hypothetical protein BV25DRAFT_1525598 [Artomyces pyxidatus]